MKTLLLKLKKLALSPLRFFEYLLSEAKVVKAVCVTSIIFLVALFCVDIQNTNKKIGLLKSNVALQLLIKERDHVIEEQNLEMEEMITVLKQQGLHINEAIKILNIQSEFIKKLIERLKELKSWPLEQLEPGSHTRAGVELNDSALEENGLIRKVADRL